MLPYSGRALPGAHWVWGGAKQPRVEKVFLCSHCSQASTVYFRDGDPASMVILCPHCGKFLTVDVCLGG